MDIVLTGLLGGLVTGFVPCILPVLRVILLPAGAGSGALGVLLPKGVEAYSFTFG